MRSFPIVFVVIGLLVTSCTSGGGAGRERLPLPLAPIAIVQGATDERSTQVAVLHKASEPVRLVLREPGVEPGLEPAGPEDKGYLGSEWKVLRARFDGLKAGVKYSLQVLRPDGTLRDVRELRTLDTKKARVRFAIASCMDDAYSDEQAAMWNDLLSRSPDVLFLIGDNSYADRPTIPGIGTTPNTLWKRYAETRDLLAVFRTASLVPTLAVWDDHDYGVNDGDRTYRFRNESREIFEAFFPQSAIPGVLERGPGVSSRLVAFGQQFFLMDDRMFRAPALAKEDETHWGKDQENWLYRNLGKGSPPAWIMNGDQFFGAYHRFESYERLHPNSFRAFLAQLKKLPTPAVLVSGDRHLAELMAIGEKDVGYKTFELTTSAIHAKVFPDAWKATPNPRQIAGASGVFNYAIVDSEAMPGGVKFSVTAYGPQGRVLFDKNLQVKR